MIAEFVERLDFGHRYLKLLSKPPWADWADGYAVYVGGGLDGPAALLLAHPMWLRSPGRRERIYGKRRFEPVRDAELYNCRAEAIWGYSCNVEDQPIQFDHRFPYAFGGPTIAPNRLPLCALHNAGKSSDVHLFPWETGEPSWLTPLLQRLEPWT